MSAPGWYGAGSSRAVHLLGLSLIDRSPRHDFKGDANIVFDPEDLQATRTIPLHPVIICRTAAREAQR